MAILIDPPAWPAHGTLWSHLVSDSDYEELHAFAARLRLPRRGFDLDHYDVPASLHSQAVALGAKAVTAREIVHQLRGAGLRVRQAERTTVTPIRRRQYLTAEWAALGASLDSRLTERHRRPQSQQRIDDWQALGSQLIARWNEAHRRYHDERHLEDVLLALDHLAVRGERVQTETLLAAWFHDAVYHGDGGADERNSAELAVAQLGDFGLDSGLVHQVGEFIVATIPATQVKDPAAPLAHLLDADLSIFASPIERYEQYAEAVRQEYAHVPHLDFVTGRSAILASYVNQTAIYRTRTAQQLWEQRARENLTREIDALEHAVTQHTA